MADFGASAWHYSHRLTVPNDDARSEADGLALIQDDL